MIESWLPVPGYVGAYMVSDKGRVKSVPRIVKGKNGTLRNQPAKVLKPTINTKGYGFVSLSHQGRVKTLRVHRLVLLAFVGEPVEGQEGCHGNGDPRDNRLTNLRWGTRSENMFDRVKHGNHYQTLKTHCPQGHPLTPDNLVPASLPRRGCLTCLHTSNHRRGKKVK